LTRSISWREVMRAGLKTWAIAIACTIHGLFPKRDVALLYGWPDYEDNVMALEAELRGTRVKRTVVLVSSTATPRPGMFGPRTVVAAKRSVRGLLHFMTARYLFFTHSCYTPRFPGRVVSVNVWHGMPVKRVGWMTNNPVPRARYSLATSLLWQPVIQESLRPVEGVLITGLPRNDRLLLGDAAIPARLGYSPEDCRTLIAWLPTYRSFRDKSGGTLRRTHSLAVAAETLEELDRLLQRHKAVCVVKPHPLAVHDGLPEFDCLRFVTDGWLSRQGLTLYQLVGASDALVTDISSVYVDYLILDRPIVHYFHDLREYEGSRGFSLAPIDDYVAGPVSSDAESFLAAISDILEGRDTHADARRRLAQTFHAHSDGSATGRLLQELGLSSTNVQIVSL
jgi:CDP-glycerol glycerophosphotransferase